MSIHHQKQIPVQFPNPSFRIDPATALPAQRDLKRLREIYLARRFGLTPAMSSLIAERAFHVEASR